MRVLALSLFLTVAVLLPTTGNAQVYRFRTPSPEVTAATADWQIRGELERGGARVGGGYYDHARSRTYSADADRIDPAAGGAQRHLARVRRRALVQRRGGDLVLARSLRAGGRIPRVSGVPGQDGQEK